MVHMREAVIQVLNQIDDVMYYPILIIVMAVAGCYFTILTRGVQIRLFREFLPSCHGALRKR